MDVIEKLTNLLKNNRFVYKEKVYQFQSCKKVNSNLMVLTDKDTIQIPLGAFNSFYESVKDTIQSLELSAYVKEFVPNTIPNHQVVLVPEMPKTYQKLSNSFDSLIDAIDGSTDENLKFLEAKAKMLTSLAQTAVNMENSRINLIKLINGK